MPSKTISRALIKAAKQLTEALETISFPAPITHVYTPLDYAWEAHEHYLKRFGANRKAIVFLGMNPGPFGMMQTAVPFGEVSFVKNWMGICDGVRPPALQHPKKPIDGFACQRSEVSGRRLWGLFEEKFGTADAFFENHFVVNYCPLVFLEESGRNFTPDKLPANVARTLEQHCDTHLQATITALQPEWLIGVGTFARKRAEMALQEFPIKIGQILHPSPASPAANRGWASQATKQLGELGIWTDD